MAIFKFVKMWKGALDSFAVETNESLYDLSLNYIKQIDSMLPCVCSVIAHRRRQNVVITSLTHSVISSCATFLFLPHFDVICDLLQTHDNMESICSINHNLEMFNFPAFRPQLL